MQRLLGLLLARYLSFVWKTCTIVYCEDDEARKHLRSRIVATWHGQTFLAPFVREPIDDFVVLIAKGRFGSVYAHAFQSLGLHIVRGSAGRDFRQSGGYTAVRQLLRALASGSAVALTVDIPKVARVAGPGVIALARHSGRSVIPMATVTSRRVCIPWRWDRPQINLPFGHVVIAVGEPIKVENKSDPQYLEAKRSELEDALNAVNARALARATRVARDKSTSASGR